MEIGIVPKMVRQILPVIFSFLSINFSFIHLAHSAIMNGAYFMAYKNMIMLNKLMFVVALIASFNPLQAGALDIKAIQIQTDQAHILRLDKPVKSVIIGNDAIADATMQDARTIVLTGRSNGVTNLVVMDQNGDTLLDEKVMVGQNDLATTRIYRGANVLVMSCTPNCEPKIITPKL